MVNMHAQQLSNARDDAGTSCPVHRGYHGGRQASGGHSTHSQVPQLTLLDPYSERSFSSRFTQHPKPPPHAQPPQFLSLGSRQQGLELVQLKRNEFEF